MSNVEETIKDRHEKYGSFREFSEKLYKLKDTAYRCGDKGVTTYNHLGVVHLEGLNMIFIKIARILTGDPDLIDNWHDIAGYARLVEIELIKLAAEDVK